MTCVSKQNGPHTAASFAADKSPNRDGVVDRCRGVRVGIHSGEMFDTTVGCELHRPLGRIPKFNIGGRDICQSLLRDIRERVNQASPVRFDLPAHLRRVERCQMQSRPYRRPGMRVRRVEQYLVAMQPVLRSGESSSNLVRDLARYAEQISGDNDNPSPWLSDDCKCLGMDWQRNPVGRPCASGETSKPERKLGRDVRHRRPDLVLRGPGCFVSTEHGHGTNAHGEHK